MGHVTVPIGGTLPDAHGGKMRWLETCYVPLVDAVIGNSIQPNFAVRPGCMPGPFDAIMEVLGLARREEMDIARRAAAAASIDTHTHVIVRDPLFRIDHFPALIFVS